MAANSEPTSIDLQDSMPIIDYSLLTVGTADDRSKVVREIGRACQDWGCFMVRLCKMIHLPSFKG